LIREGVSRCRSLGVPRSPRPFLSATVNFLPLLLFFRARSQIFAGLRSVYFRTQRSPQRLSPFSRQVVRLLSPPPFCLKAVREYPFPPPTFLPFFAVIGKHSSLNLSPRLVPGHPFHYLEMDSSCPFCFRAIEMPRSFPSPRPW